jgi:hypothetical protein
MKITEVAKTNDEALMESIVAENDTGYSNNDLFNIVKTAQLPDSAWTTYTADEMLARIDKLCGTA